MVVAGMGVASLLLVTGNPAVAADDFYREVVPVASQSQGDRQRAAGRGLAAVLVRIAGTDQVLQSDKVREALRQADGYLEQFGYQSSVDGTADASGEAYQLVMEFQPEATTALLRDAGLPVWSGKRPRILAWLELNDSAGQRLVSRSGPAEWSEAVQEEARRRGLPLVLPESGRGLAAADVAQQMNAELVYRGVVRSSGGSCSSQWSLALADAQEQWSFNGTGQQCVALAVDELAETLSSRYAFAASAATGQTVMLQVAGVGQFDDYSAVLRMLGELPAVRAVTLQGVDGDRLRFALQLRASRDSLERALALQPLLVESGPQPDLFASTPVASTGAAEQATAAPGALGGPGDVTAVGSASSNAASSSSASSSTASSSFASSVDAAAQSASTLYYQLRPQPYGGG